MTDSIKQQFYLRLADATTGLGALGFTVYGSEAGLATDGPPPVDNAPTPWAYLRFLDEVAFGALGGGSAFDGRALVQVRLGDGERRGYGRINAGLAVCAAVFAPSRTATYTDPATTEFWWQPAPAGVSPEMEDPDRPGTLLRYGEWAFHKAVQAALHAAVA
jgi:hypothetical protein